MVGRYGWAPFVRRSHALGADVSGLADLDADLTNPSAPAALVTAARQRLGPIRALVLCHAESVDSSILGTSVESFDRHMAVNARAAWLLIKAFAEQFEAPAEPGAGRVAGSIVGPVAGSIVRPAAGSIVAFTSDHVAHNLPYGASKGALDRIVLAAAVELAAMGITANVINPGATDTGWMSENVRTAVLAGNLQARIGLPADAAALVRFLLSEEGSWINGQILYSNGGLRP